MERPFFALVSEFFDDVFAPNSKSARTLFAICFKPAYLTKEYFSGRKARYIQPVRLYLITSILFFFFISVFNTGPFATTIVDNGNDAQPSQDAPILDDSFKLDISWPGLTAEKSTVVNDQLKIQFEKALALATENPDQARDMVIDAAPPIVFCLVPLFALLLKLVFLNQSRFYAEHLVLALHNHSFLFIAFLLETLMDKLAPTNIRDWLQAPVDAWIFIYLLLSLKNNYGEGWASTLIKFFMLVITYWIFFALIAVTAGIVGILTL